MVLVPPSSSPRASSSSKAKPSPARAASTPSSKGAGKKARRDPRTPSSSSAALPPSAAHATTTPNGKLAAGAAAAIDVLSAPPAPGWEFEVVAGSAVPKQAPVFTPNAAHFILPHPTQLRLHSAADLSPVSTITSPRLANHHTGPITVCLLNPLNALQLLTASLDGTVKVWDYLDGSCLRTIVCPGPVEQLVVGQTGDAKGRWWASVRGEGKDKRKRRKEGKENIKGHQGPQSTIYELYVSTSSSASSSTAAAAATGAAAPRPHLRIARIRHSTALMLSPSGSFLVALAGQKAYVLPTQPERMAEGFTKFVSPDVLTCGAMHPFEDWFVSGDAKGVVRLWFCLGELASGRPSAADFGEQASLLADDGAGSDKEASTTMTSGPAQKASAGVGIRTTPTTTLHWHSHAVSSIAFTSAGTSILSAGEEAVVVAWSVADGSKTFVPRVGGPIASVVVRPPGAGREEEWWVGLANGGLRRLGGDGKGGRNVLGGWESARIEPSTASRTNKDRPSPLAFHRPTGSILLPAGHPSSIQLYSPARQSAILELEVAPSNRVSRAAEKEVEPVRVELAALGQSADGLGWLATADRREADEEEGQETARTIKVWRWDTTLQTYVLTTRLDKPHQTDVGSLAFSPVAVGLPGAAQPSLLLLSTSAADGVARLWREKRTRFKSGKVEASFQPLSLLSHRGAPIHGSSWSPDASVLALAQGALITIWDPATSILRGSLSSPDVPSIHKVAFAGAGGRYIVGAGQKKGLAVWDLVVGEVVWSSPLTPVEHFTVSADLATFTTADCSSQGVDEKPLTTFAVYAPTSAKPLRTRSIPRRVRSVAPFPPATNGPADVAVLAVADNWDVLVVGDGASDAFDTLAFDSTRSVDLDAAASAAGPSLFDEIFGAQAGPSTSQAPSSATGAGRKQAAPKKWTSLDEIFDASAQVLPAMSMVFDEVLDHVLSKRSIGGTDGELEGDADEEAADGMDVDEPLPDDADDTSRREWQARELPSSEVADLADFFRTLSTNGGSAAPRPSDGPRSRLVDTMVNGGGSSGPAAGTPVKTTRAAALRSQDGAAAASTPKMALSNGSSFEAETPQGSGKKRKSKAQ